MREEKRYIFAHDEVKDILERKLGLTNNADSLNISPTKIELVFNGVK